ncbi:hypothetical protein ACFL27_08390 [candidate division CSSED10-310 bacterium]|uniref:PABS domain-containing protein n=1 Tax=candidate division CSSED10-310 bacterium TaxID=2855610 RepID=A0ABV6YVH3_UNCC1
MSRKLLSQENQSQFQLQLWEHFINDKKEYEIVMNGVFLMASYNHLSSELLLRIAIQKIQSGAYLDILIGGLGMGYTVAEACSYDQVRSIDVVEIEPLIITWNRAYFKDSNQNCLADERVSLIKADFYDYILNTDENYDVICLDIDNGPLLLVKESNRRVYEDTFLLEVKKNLKPGALFCLWAGSEDHDLFHSMKMIFANCWVEEVIEWHQNREVIYYLYFAQ